jgi:large subunit ribosomal protein L7A
MISESDKSRLQTGFKQTIRALHEQKAQKAFLADDCEEKISSPVTQLCEKSGVPLEHVSSMHELGKLCEIEVRASCAVVLK